jgi:ankyrin repeat protein
LQGEGRGKGESALFAAAECGHTAVVQALIDARADVNQLQGEGRVKGESALFAAAECGHTAIVQALIDARADVNQLQGEGRVRGESALHVATQKRHMATVEKILAVDNVDVNYQNVDGYTALMLAAENGCLEIVQMILNKGVNVHNANTDGLTALMLAERSGFNAIAEAIRSARQLVRTYSEAQRENSTADEYTGEPSRKRRRFT